MNEPSGPIGTHIGDGVYLSGFDGAYWWLSTQRGDRVERIALEPGALVALVARVVAEVPEMGQHLARAAGGTR